MFRIAALALALTAGPAIASSHYHAEPLAQPAKAKVVSKGIVWNCGAGGCAGGKGNSRPAIVCASLVRQVGAVRSFSAGGVSLGAQDLEKCNARAR